MMRNLAIISAGIRNPADVGVFLPRGEMTSKDKHLFILLIDLVLYSVLLDSVQTASFPHYPELRESDQCSISVFVAEVPSGATGCFYPPVLPYFLCLYLLLESPIFLYRLFTVTGGFRAPPSAFLKRMQISRS